MNASRALPAELSPEDARRAVDLRGLPLPVLPN